MSTSSSNTVSPPAQIARPDKTNKQSKIVVLKLSAASLGRFLPKPTPRKNSKAKSTPSTVSTPTTVPVAATAAPTSSPPGDASESNATPAPGATEASKTKGTGARAGTKRAFGQTGEAASKGRGRPGPKKKPRLEDGTIDHSGKPIAAGPTNATHKLGPKANQGAINAGLRALDRSGKPCRKWEKKSIQLKSFTGVVWELASWRAPKRKLPNEDGRESNDNSQPSGSKANDSSTAMDSEKSHAGANGVVSVMESTPAASSPITAPLLPAVPAMG